MKTKSDLKKPVAKKKPVKKVEVVKPVEKSKNKVGRKHTLAEKGPLILESLRLGNTNRGAAYSAKVSEDCFYRWFNQGLRDVEDGLETEFSEFYEGVNEAVEAAKTYALDCWRKHMPDDWRAAMAYLERRDKDNYSVKQIMDIKQEVSQISILEIEDNGFGNSKEDN